ncbi:hypothetical protein D3C87_1683090 [compost metagenome]
MKLEMPLLPLLLSVIAMTTTYLAWVALVMKFLAPLMTKWSPSRTAVVCWRAESEPAWGSVRAHEPMYWPEVTKGSQSCFCFSEPK